MSAAAIPPKLLPLVEYLDQLRSRADLKRLEALLAQSQATLEDVRDFVHYDPGHYTRNLVCRGTWYEILVICWLSGQRSPIHNHAQSTCGLKVLEGICSETVYAPSPCGQVVPLRTTEKFAGEICATEDDDTHQVSNLQGPGENLVTLHIYSPPLRKMKKFSITGGVASDWEPPVLEFAGGEGI
ncbi:MAG: cysteine dioxygenase family protein [Verrucomicrobia bacterium]|nr:cysteine dioxygenase family protein [Verrucomicrobiota bacterium]